MLMNIFSRIWTAIKANINALIDRWEDPQDVLDQSIRDMQKQVNRLRGDVISVVAEEKKLKNQVEKYQKEVERWEKNAMLALKEGNESLAREALRRKQDAVKFAQQLHPQWEQQQRLATQLKEEFHGLRDRIQDAQRKKRNLITRLRHAETQKRLQGLLTDLSDNQVFEQFENQLLDTEAMNAAQEELQASSLEHQFEALESSGDMAVDQELEALKARLHLNE
ncbi:PspA/IM30 family protein [candidate division KSB3 bacterium]|uniref:PspA/IM30 family protein n=1 Tax=candidate division KSB3 bacterium TaxID=2044937 RepID=A0A9D5JY15_9BACT|nr:PspA/IM30 family protein [candidate division KSB3 bacterium]MBD3326061.1 PspA/IM30 family protein [candidate division KSB3 bacterium]